MDTAMDRLVRDWVPLADARRVGGWDSEVLRRRLRRLRIETFVDPIDTRRRLLRREDFQRLMTPRPANGQGGDAMEVG